jgi:hypothetical protein
MFLLRNVLAGNHQLVAADLIGDGYVTPTYSGKEKDYYQHWELKNCNL